MFNKITLYFFYLTFFVNVQLIAQSKKQQIENCIKRNDSLVFANIDLKVELNHAHYFLKEKELEIVENRNLIEEGKHRINDLLNGINAYTDSLKDLSNRLYLLQKSLQESNMEIANLKKEILVFSRNIKDTLIWESKHFIEGYGLGYLKMYLPKDNYKVINEEMLEHSESGVKIQLANYYTHVFDLRTQTSFYSYEEVLNYFALNLKDYMVYHGGLGSVIIGQKRNGDLVYYTLKYEELSSMGGNTSGDPLLMWSNVVCIYVTCSEESQQVFYKIIGELNSGI